MSFHAYFVQVSGQPAVYLVTLGGTRHVKNPTEKAALIQGGVSTTVLAITETELTDLLEVE